MAIINRYNLGKMHLIETPVAGQIKNIVNMFSHCSSNNCLFLQKRVLWPVKKILAGKFYHVTGHWQVWQKVSFRPWIKISCSSEWSKSEIRVDFGGVKKDLILSFWSI